jgi:hypothetical protein
MDLWKLMLFLKLVKGKQVLTFLLDNEDNYLLDSTNDNLVVE